MGQLVATTMGQLVATTMGQLVAATMGHLWVKLKFRLSLPGKPSLNLNVTEPDIFDAKVFLGIQN